MALRRFRYSMAHIWLTNLGFGELIPVFHAEVTPGDTWAGSSNLLVRCAPMERPAFVALNIHVHFFFVPHRTVWNEFEDMITGVATPTWPTVNLNSNNQDLIRAFGVGTHLQPSGSFDVNALPIRALNACWNEFYRDQKIQAQRTLDTLSVPRVNFPTSDYYASVRTEVQQGDVEKVDTTGGSFDVTTLRDAMHRQRFRERRSQFGERYVDYLAAMGVQAPDSRLDRPEHCCRAKAVLGISEVVATATSTGEKTGAMKGHGIAGVHVPFRRRRFVEHGTLIGLMHIRPRNQLLHRVDPVWRIRNKDDLFQMELSRDTQVPVRAQEAWSQAASPEAVFGYTRRDEWLRSLRDTVAGRMQESANLTWSTSRNFTSMPSVADMLEVPQFNHLFQEQASDSVYFQVYASHRIGAQRIVPRAQR